MNYIGLKLLTAAGESLRVDRRVTYKRGLKRGQWQTIPGNGAYLAVTNGLTVGGFGPTLAVFEYDPASTTGHGPNGVVTAARVRWLNWTPKTKDQRKAWAEYAKARAEYDKAGAECDKAWAECDKAGAEYAKAGAEYAKARAECDKAWAECDKAWAEYAKAGNILVAAIVAGTKGE